MWYNQVMFNILFLLVAFELGVLYEHRKHIRGKE